MVVGKVKRWCSARLHLVKLYLPYTWRDQVHHHAVRVLHTDSSVWIAYSRYAIANYQGCLKLN